MFISKNYVHYFVISINIYTCVIVCKEQGRSRVELVSRFPAVAVPKASL